MKAGTETDFNTITVNSPLQREAILSISACALLCHAPRPFWHR